jgi:hypothetical protein
MSFMLKALLKCIEYYGYIQLQYLGLRNGALGWRELNRRVPDGL